METKHFLIVHPLGVGVYSFMQELLNSVIPKEQLLIIYSNQLVQERIPELKRDGSMVTHHAALPEVKPNSWVIFHEHGRATPLANIFCLSLFDHANFIILTHSADEVDFTIKNRCRCLDLSSITKVCV